MNPLTANPQAEPQFVCSEAWREWWRDPTLRARVLDSIERFAILGLFVSFVSALCHSMAASALRGESVVIGDLMLLITETMMVIFVVLRRSARNLSLRTGDWALAFAATCLSLLARPCQFGPLFGAASLGIALAMSGLSIQFISKLTLGRRFGVVAANRGICSTGVYSIVRHPIYFGYVLLHTGFFILNPSLWNLGVFTLLYTIKIPRILAEERLLSLDPEYRDYMAKVPSRLIPGLF
jgi:protein-S-isoprenylcysteine O-methyltransferase Ste14